MRNGYEVGIVLVVAICILTTGGMVWGDLRASKRPWRTSSMLPPVRELPAASSSSRRLRVLVAPSSAADPFRECIKIDHSQGWTRGKSVGNWFCCRMALVRPSIRAGGVTRIESFRCSTSCSSRFLSKSSMNLTRRSEVYWSPWGRRCDVRAKKLSLSRIESDGAGEGAPTELSLEEQSPDHGAPRCKHKAVIIPGFSTDALLFKNLSRRLSRRGISSVVVPIRWYHWLPTLGGRSVRPILDRIYETVIRRVSDGRRSKKTRAPYSFGDFLAEMIDPKRGARQDGPLNLSLTPVASEPDEKVILIAHSAGGWITRIFLSDACYDGRTYNASSLVKGLVTLGTPHVRFEDSRGQVSYLPFRRNLEFVLERCTGESGGGWEERTPTTCVGGSVVRGRRLWGGLLRDLPYVSYKMCCGDGTGFGDGITPLECALGMQGATRLVEIKGVYHSQGFGGPWYGSDSVIDMWLEPALETIFGSSS